MMVLPAPAGKILAAIFGAFATAALVASWLGAEGDGGFTWGRVAFYAVVAASSATAAFEGPDTDRRALARVCFAFFGVLSVVDACVLISP